MREYKIENLLKSSNGQSFALFSWVLRKHKQPGAFNTHQEFGALVAETQWTIEQLIYSLILDMCH